MHWKRLLGAFLGGPVARALHFHYRGTGLIPGWATKIPYAEWCGQKNNLKKASDCFVENRWEVSRKSRLRRTWIWVCFPSRAQGLPIESMWSWKERSPGWLPRFFAWASGRILQHHSSKAPIPWCSAFLQSSSHNQVWPVGRPQPWLYGPLSAEWRLLFNMLSRFVITFLPRNSRFWSHGCSHRPQWFWSPRRGNLSQFPPFPLLFAMQ